MIEKIKALGTLVGEIEKISPQYYKKLIMSYPSRFFTHKEDFISAYVKIIEDAIKAEINVTKYVITAKELDEYKYDRNEAAFNLQYGYFEVMTNFERKKIGSKIKELREQKGLSQKQLAELTNMLQPNIDRIEKGLYSTGLDILKKIAFALDVELYFISDTE